MTKSLSVFLMAAALFVSGCGASGPEKLRTDAPPRELKPPAAVEDDIAVYFSPGGGGMAGAPASGQHFGDRLHVFVGDRQRLAGVLVLRRRA